jgi:hypothetical protein
MSFEFYKVLHIAGLLLTVFGLFGLIAVYWNDSAPKPALRKALMMSHGIGLLILLVAGFGLAARLNLMGQLPGWVYGKLGIWLLVGGAPALIKRQPKKAAIWLVVTLILVLLAVTFAVTKPF